MNESVKDDFNTRCNGTITKENNLSVVHNDSFLEENSSKILDKDILSIIDNNSNTKNFSMENSLISNITTENAKLDVRF